MSDEFAVSDDNKAMHREYAKDDLVQKRDAHESRVDDFRATDEHADDPGDRSGNYVNLSRMTGGQRSVDHDALDESCDDRVDPLRCVHTDDLH